ncbi:PUTATIVE SIMILARITY TO EPOXIDASE SUBUNIT A PROTEIN (fragment) [Mesorhizobium prunaredense]|uniref:PUTATIVE SIMILARITY TO EPOXIDASE SUBUNIT A PROTEIN n=1 Tax=Mesorhizobium prunaredense TaxID=1631249 RepID=A0A1R3V7X9_9HYPH
MLTEAQKDKWHKDGYVTLKRFFDPAAVERTSSFVDDVSGWDVSDDKWMLWLEKTTESRKITSKAKNFLDFHDPLRNLLLEDQRITSSVEELLDGESRRLKELLIYIIPTAGAIARIRILHKLPDRMVHSIVAP